MTEGQARDWSEHEFWRGNYQETYSALRHMQAVLFPRSKTLRVNHENRQLKLCDIQQRGGRYMPSTINAAEPPIDLPRDLNDGDGITVRPADFIQAQQFKAKWVQHHDGWCQCREDAQPWATSFSQDNAQGFAMIEQRRVRGYVHIAYHTMYSSRISLSGERLVVDWGEV